MLIQNLVQKKWSIRESVFKKKYKQIKKEDKLMVVEIKAYKNEITGKIYEDRYKAIESEEKEEVKKTAENIANELGFSNFREVVQ